MRISFHKKSKFSPTRAPDKEARTPSPPPRISFTREGLDTLDKDERLLSEDVKLDGVAGEHCRQDKVLGVQ